MNQIFLFPVTEMLDITKIEEYNQEFIKTYINSWEPFVTKNNFDEYLRRMNDYREGKGNDGLKEIFYWLFDKDKIVGSGSIRLNPEIDKITETYAGHIFCQIVPTYRKQGYGTIICHLLLQEMKKDLVNKKKLSLFILLKTIVLYSRVTCRALLTTFTKMKN